MIVEIDTQWNVNIAVEDLQQEEAEVEIDTQWNVNEGLLQQILSTIWLKQIHSGM